MSLTTPGFSDAAESVDRYRSQVLSQLRNNETFCLASKLREELSEVWSECRQAGWDGYGAVAVSEETFLNVYELLENLPLGLPTPSISAEPDGHLTLEWYRTPTRLLSVSVDRVGDLHFAAKLGPNRLMGTEIARGAWPARITELVREVTDG